jgi:hypothetical protein
MKWLEFVILALATWRVATMLVNEPGPFHVFTRLRKATGIQHDADEKIKIIPDRFAAGILSCVWCSSVWVGAAWVTAWLLAPEMTIFTATIFALSAAAVWMEEKSGKR